MSERLLDARGLKCPLAPQDFRDFCASQGHEFVEASEAAGAFACLIRALARP